MMIIYAKDYGVVDNGQDVSDKLQDAFDYMDSIGGARPRKLIIEGRIKLSSSVGIGKPARLTVDATAAKINSFHDGSVINCNFNADPFYSSQAEQHGFRWIGGYFESKATTNEQSRALIIRGFRDVAVEDVELEGYHTAIDFSGKDTIRFERIKISECTHHLRNTGWQVSQSIIGLQVIGCHFAASGAASVIELNEPSLSTSIDRCTVSLGNSEGTKIVLVRRLARAYLSTGASSALAGQTVTGDQSSETATIHSVVDMGSGARLVFLKGLSGDFIDGEKLIGPSWNADDAVIDNGKDMGGIRVAGLHVDHNESSYCEGVRIEDLVGTGSRIGGVHLDTCQFKHNGDYNVGVFLDRVRGARIDSSKFAFGSGPTGHVPLWVTSDCREVIVDESNYFATGGPQPIIEEEQ